MMKFKKGDRVKCITKDHYKGLYNKRGKILAVRSTYLIEFEDWTRGHEGGLINGKEGSCWWLSERKLELVNNSKDGKAVRKLKRLLNL